MLALKYIRENVSLVSKSAEMKKTKIDLDEILSLDSQRRGILQEVEELKASRNKASSLIAEKKRQGEDAADVILEMRQVSESIKKLDETLKSIEDKLENLLYYIPNVIHDSVPAGDNEEDNVFLRDWGSKPVKDFALKDHMELGESLELFDLKRATKISGSGFPLYTGNGARLERSLINFMLDFHTEEHGYKELFPPFLTSREATTTTGQLPKFEEDMYKIPTDDLYCISTAEIPVTNVHRNEILNEDDLPINYAAYSACFRREAGSYGKDTRGLLRVHQFNKVEMVKFVTQDSSYDELEILTGHAEAVLQKLGLHYRIVTLCGGDLSFSAAKCYDIEVWAPGMEKYLEVSSCSNFQDFQARRGNIRYRSKADNSLQFVHTLNGSGVATPRLMIALLETYQNADGSISIPPVLQKYMGAESIG
ncbi:MAG: serine--tRNA ligase [FCB group bacterium]|nr:serine--tRNA ligase [FCB group bacterium]